MADEVKLETTEEAHKKLKPRPPERKWTQVDKSNWTAVIDGEPLPARIRMLDARTFAAYRDTKYLGSERTLELAKMRVDVNAVSQKNKVMQVWEQDHPDELPPFLVLTPEERAEYWRRNPPVAAPRMAGGSRTGRVPSADPAQSSGPRKGLVDDTTVPFVAAAKSLAKTAKAKEPKGSKDAEIAAMLKRGCTSEEVLRVTGWKAVSMPAMAKKLGLGLRIEKGTKPFKYYGEEKK